MERNLKFVLQNYLDNFDKYRSLKINNYFNSDFSDDYEEFEKDKSNIEALEYLNDEFIDIDTDYLDSPNLDNKVKSVLEEAINKIMK